MSDRNISLPDAVVEDRLRKNVLVVQVGGSVFFMLVV